VTPTVTAAHTWLSLDPHRARTPVWH